MEAASWPSGAAADTRVDEVDEEELEDSGEAPHQQRLFWGDPLPYASMNTRAAPSTGRSPCERTGRAPVLAYPQQGRTPALWY